MLCVQLIWHKQEKSSDKQRITTAFTELLLRGAAMVGFNGLWLVKFSQLFKWEMRLQECSSSTRKSVILTFELNWNTPRTKEVEGTES